MSAITVNATEFSRGLSDFLNQVQYKGQVLDIERGKRVIARVSPVEAAGGYPLARLDALLQKAPKLLPDDAVSMAADVKSERAKLVNRPDPWAS